MHLFINMLKEAGNLNMLHLLSSDLYRERVLNS